MTANTKFLINHLKAHVLNGRFKNCQIKNRDPATGKKIGIGGAFSVIFKATDLSTGLPVAVKFFDPDITGPALKFRLDLFERENELLSELSGGIRALSLVQPITQFSLQLTTPGGHQVNVTFQYFVTDWLDGSVEKYFLDHKNYSNEDKLTVFRECCLAIFALHNNEIAHRDIKPDNIRLGSRNGRNIGIAIDLGTAVAYQSPSLGTPADYQPPIGAPAYAPVESLCGLIGIRQLGYAADYYALGCLLYELFSPDYYFQQIFQSPDFVSFRAACELHILNVKQKGVANDSDLLKEWHWIVRITRGQVTPPQIDRAVSSARPSTVSTLNLLLTSLTALDYRQRLTNSARVLRLIDSAFRILDNHRADQRAAAERQRRRENRRKKEEKKARKLQEYVERKKGNGNGQ